ncbi:type IV toxin-antitoxin system AbiEi family antitoxin domain-containing protein [Pseudomonas aeruginosa]|nr:type IV toxin-antitoxin system AbiEi family antitoxin domain-containing protein [Pseudomonas aeruginosa]
MSSTDFALSVSTRIAQRVKRLPKGQPFCISRFAELGARGAISKAVARLVSQGELERVHRGIYMRPKSSRYVARVRPNVWEVVSLIARQNRHVLQIHGAHAVRLFGLSTQVPLIPIYYTSGPSRSFFIGKGEVRLVHAAPMVMQRAGTEVGTAEGVRIFV